MERFIALLKSTNLFKNISENELVQIFDSNYKIKEYEKNSIIYLQNEKCDSLDVILEGEITVQKVNSDGKILTINNFISGDVLGENLIFSVKNNYPMTIIAKNDSILLHLNKDIVLSLCQTNKFFLINFLQSLSNKTLILTDKIKSLSLKTIRQCIVEFLLFEYHSQGKTKIELSMSKKDLAEKIGVQRSSLSRELNKMRKDGLIYFTSKYITINDVQLLKKFHIEN